MRIFAQLGKQQLRVEVLKGRQAHQTSTHSTWQCALNHVVFKDACQPGDTLVLLDLLDRVCTGLFDVLLLVPPTATRSRTRHSEFVGQRPFLIRSGPFGLDGLSPSTTLSINNTDNLHCEIVAWFVTQSLLCSHCRIGLD